MTKKERALLAIELLKQVYPDAICSLDYEKPHELLISTRLAAQCTDARVNIVTKDLYQKYQSLEDFASADLAELEEMVRPCGFYHTKAKDIIAMSQMLLDQYGGVLPDTVEELTKLPLALQVNADTLLRWGTRRQGLELLELTETPLLGSDCHDMTKRPPNLKGGREMVRRKLGEAFLAQMDENARRLTAPTLAQV